MHLESIHIYPVKGTHGITIDRKIRVEPRGLEHDRRWMLVDPNGVFLSQRTYPALALVQAHIVEDGMFVEAPGMPNMHVPVPAERKESVRIWKDNVEAYGVKKEVSQWFSRYLNTPCRLVYMADDVIRKVDPVYDPDHDSDRTDVSFADGYPLLLTSMASLEALNTRLKDPVPMNRFRPNLVIAGGKAFAEDTWSLIRVGDMRFHVVKPCTRCVVTTIDQDTAVQSKEPLRTLNQMRRVEGNVYFGENLIPAQPGMVRKGDPVTVLVSRRHFFTFRT